MTVQHIVMLEFNDGVDEDTRMNSLKAVEALKDKIDGIEKIESGKDADIKPGNALPLGSIPVGTIVHNVELQPGRGGQIARYG